MCLAILREGLRRLEGVLKLGLCKDTVRAFLHRNYGTVDSLYRKTVIAQP
jgi:hypothetical protein